MKAVLCWCGWLLLTALVYVYSKNPLTLALPAASALLPPVCALANLLAARGLRLSLRAPTSASMGGRAVCVLKMESRAALFGVAEAELLIKNALTGETETLRVSLPHRMLGVSQVELAPGTAHCGALMLSVVRLRLRDPFGILAVRSRARCSARLSILPEIYPVELIETGELGLGGDGGEFSPVRAGPELDEVFSLRDYAEGDEPRRIHWRLTAKYGRLIIREGSMPVRRSLLVFCSRQTPEGGLEPEQSDALCAAAFSVCVALTEKGISYVLAWRSGEEYESRAITDADALLAALPALLGAGFSDCAADELAGFLTLNDRDSFSLIIRIAPSAVSPDGLPDGCGLLDLSCDGGDARPGTDTIKI